ncbi:MAG: dihydrodipicolinate synthase family protein [Spirochaetes bacterium]|nr:dihydrodipicolinate synthase family protein [Spirochaetota bacterium]
MKNRIIPPSAGLPAKGFLTQVLRGIVTVLNTPFTNDDQIDIQSLRKNMDRALRAGVAGFLVPALAGEVGQLSFDERMVLVRTVIEAVREDKFSRVPVQPSSGATPASTDPLYVIGGATAGDRRERVRVSEALIRLGCEGILVWIPYTTEEEYLEQVREIASLKPPFLMLQDWDPAGAGLPIPLIQRVFEEVEEFQALKIETVPAGPKYTAVLEATGGKLHVSGGWAVTQMIEGLDRGVHAFMPTGMHEIYCEIYRRYTSGNRDGAVSLFRQILPVLAFSNQHLDLSILFFKRLLWKEGTYHTPRCRSLSLAFDSLHQRTADELIELAIRTRESLTQKS